MKKSRLLIFLIALPCISPYISACVTTLPSKTQRQYDRSKLFPFSTDSTPEHTRSLALKLYEKCPPLHSERFRRRVKILLGIDVNDYPEDAELIIGVFALSVKYQTIRKYDDNYQYNKKEGDIEPPIPITPFPDSILVELAKYLFFDDKSSFRIMKEYVGPATDKYFEEADERKFIENLYEELYSYYDVLVWIYPHLIGIRPELIPYLDLYPSIDGKDLSIFIGQDRDDLATRVADIKNCLIALYIKKEMDNGRTIADHYALDSSQITISYNIGEHDMGASSITDQYVSYGNKSFPWKQKNLCEQNVAAVLTYALELKNPTMRTSVIKYMTGGFDRNNNNGHKSKEVREQIRSNNYYGYTILREFCENPEREMPTLEKVGTSFDAVLAGHPKPLLLEPFADSYDIDTVLPDEAFIAYEMGYDDYYFIEIEKPVESPLAGTDGYAMILDRRETVYGYLKKEDVKKISEAEKAALKAAQERVLLQQPGRKIGFIDDPDGYVNLRKEMSVDAEIVSRIERTESFYYWEIPDKNWWFVQKRDGIKGFVHKSRIREKTSGESWIIDEKTSNRLAGHVFCCNFEDA